MKKRIWIAMAIMSLIVAVLPQKVAAVSYHEDEIEEYLLSSLVAANIPGMSLSIVTSEKEIYSAGFGEVEKTEDDLCIAAVSQTFTSLAVMQLVEEGKISLTGMVGDYLPDYSAVSAVTVEELLKQTSGIGAQQTMDSLSVGEGRGKFEESYANYNLLGLIVEKVTGMSFEEYLKQNVFDPLAMTSTCSRRDALDVVGNRVSGYKDYFGMHIKQDSGYSEGENWCQIPAGGIVSDVKDMGKYLQMYLNLGGKTVSYDSLQKMLYEGDPIGDDLFGTSTTYAYGWKETEVEDTTVLYCEGEVDDYVGAVFLIPERDAAITMLFNSADVVVGNSMVNQIEDDVISLFLDGTVNTLLSDQYLYPHIGIDLTCLVLVMLALMPLFLTGVWLRGVRRKVSVVRILSDCVIHIGIPCVILFGIPIYLESSWSILERVVPAYTYVAKGIVALLLLELVIKIILGLLFGRKKLEEPEDDEADEDEILSDNQPPLTVPTPPMTVPVQGKKATKKKGERKAEAADKKGGKSVEAKTDATGKKDEAKADETEKKDKAKADEKDKKVEAKADATEKKVEAKADTADKKDEAKADVTGKKDEAKADVTEKKGEAKADAADKKVEAKADVADKKAESKADATGKKVETKNDADKKEDVGKKDSAEAVKKAKEDGKKRKADKRSAKGKAGRKVQKAEAKAARAEKRAEKAKAEVAKAKAEIDKSENANDDSHAEGGR